MIRATYPELLPYVDRALKDMNKARLGRAGLDGEAAYRAARKAFQHACKMAGIGTTRAKKEFG